MISLTPFQQEIVDSSTITAWWVFDITTLAGASYQWSTQAIAVADDPAPLWEDGVVWEPGTHWIGGIPRVYEYRIADFSGITLRRPYSELNVVAPSEMSFTILDVNDISSFTVAWEAGVEWEAGVAWVGGTSGITISDIIGATVLVSLYIGSRSQEPYPMRRFRFRIQKVEPGYQSLRCACEDYYAQYLRGDWPNTPNPRDLWPSDADVDPIDNACLPVVFGADAYVPIDSVHITSQREYVLGLASAVYTVNKVRIPRKWGFFVEWGSGDFDFNQFTRTAGDGKDYRTVRPIVADKDQDTVADSMGLWRDGTSFIPMPCQYSSDDTVGVTSPDAVIKYILASMGVAADDIDDNSFAGVGTIMASWGLEWNGGFWRRQDRQVILSQLLAACHCTLTLEEQVELRVLSKTSQFTVDSSSILKMNDEGVGSFAWDAIGEANRDSGYAAWQQGGEAQDYLIHTLVPAKTTTTSPSKDVVNLHLVQDSQHVQKLTQLFLQRKLLADARITFDAKPGLFVLQPDDVITIIGDNYGGNNDVIINALTIQRDLSIRVEATKLSQTLDDWDDLNPSAIVIAVDDTPLADYWTLTVEGPDYPA